MKVMIAKWLAQYLFNFIVGTLNEDKFRTLTVVYYYKGADIHTVRTKLSLEHYNWLKDVQSILPLSPPENWDKWDVLVE